MNIKVDNREKTLWHLLLALRDDYGLKVTLEKQPLDIGDAIIEDGEEELVIIERKSLPDLASSIRDGRYREQSYRLDGSPVPNHNIIYLVEGRMGAYNPRFTKITHATLYITMFCLQYFKGFSVTRTFDISETAEFILRMADKLSRGKDIHGYYHSKFVPRKASYCSVISKTKKKNVTPENISEILLSQIPGISSMTASAIMAHFPSLLALLDELRRNPDSLAGITYKTRSGKRRISQSSIASIKRFLLGECENVLTVKT